MAITDKDGKALGGLGEETYPHTYPQTQIQVAQNGIAVITLYDPWHMSTVILDMNTVHDIIKVLRDQERAKAGMIDIAQRIGKGKN